MERTSKKAFVENFIKDRMRAAEEQGHYAIQR